MELIPAHVMEGVFATLIGIRKQIQNTVTSYTVTSADNGKSLGFNHASLTTVTIPDGLLVDGTEIEFCANGAAGISLVLAGSATMNGSTDPIALDQYKGATLRCIATDTYVLYGV